LSGSWRSTKEVRILIGAGARIFRQNHLQFESRESAQKFVLLLQIRINYFKDVSTSEKLFDRLWQSVSSSISFLIYQFLVQNGRPQNAPPCYVPPANSVYAAPPVYHENPQQNMNGFQAPTHVFTDRPERKHLNIRFFINNNFFSRRNSFRIRSASSLSRDCRTSAASANVSEFGKSDFIECFCSSVAVL
jgi:hypothetical protein